MDHQLVAPDLDLEAVDKRPVATCADAGIAARADVDVERPGDLNLGEIAYLEVALDDRARVLAALVAAGRSRETRREQAGGRD